MVAGYLSMTMRLPQGCHIGCQGFVDTQLFKSATTVRNSVANLKCQYMYFICPNELPSYLLFHSQDILY